MSIWPMIFLAFGLAMDAFAVSVANGICYSGNAVKISLQCGLSFGLFQSLMPLMGFFAGRSFLHLIGDIAPWLTLILLSVIGGRMIIGTVKEMRSPGKTAVTVPRLHAHTLLMQSLATSIDAFAAGVGLGVVGVNIAVSVSIIGIVTFACSFLGVFIGRLFGNKASYKAQIFGGALLILIGLNIFAEHMGAFHLF